MADSNPWRTSADTGWVTSVTIDCADPEALAQFWGRLLGLPVCPRRSRYVALRRPPTTTPELVFQPVPEPKRGKARLHLDIAVTDLPAATSRALELGASIADGFDDEGEGDGTLRVMRDPEGNEFCLIHRADGQP